MVILASDGFGVGPLQRATSTILIVFVNVTDPVGAGIAASLARPGGNATGFEQALLDLVNIWLVSRHGWRCRHRAISSRPKTRDSSFKAANADNADALKSKRAGTRPAPS
jgi:hypothetical protein